MSAFTLLRQRQEGAKWERLLISGPRVIGRTLRSVLTWQQTINKELLNASAPRMGYREVLAGHGEERESEGVRYAQVGKTCKGLVWHSEAQCILLPTKVPAAQKPMNKTTKHVVQFSSHFPFTNVLNSSTTVQAPRRDVLCFFFSVLCESVLVNS